LSRYAAFSQLLVQHRAVVVTISIVPIVTHVHRALIAQMDCAVCHAILVNIRTRLLHHRAHVVAMDTIQQQQDQQAVEYVLSETCVPMLIMIRSLARQAPFKMITVPQHVHNARRVKKRYE
jgi:hypothetical protein